MYFNKRTRNSRAEDGRKKIVDNCICVSKLLQEIDDLETSNKTTLRKVSDGIQLIRDALKDEIDNHVQFSDELWFRQHNKCVRNAARQGNHAIQFGIEAKKLIDDFISLKDVQERKKLPIVEKCAFFFKYVLDRHLAARNLSNFAKSFRKKQCAVAKIWKGGQSPYDDIVGRENDIDVIRTALIAGLGTNSSHVLYIWGEYAGIGKTTIARKVYNNDVVRSHFDCFAWIDIDDWITEDWIDISDERRIPNVLLKDLLNQLSRGNHHLKLQKDESIESVDHGVAGSHFPTAGDDIDDDGDYHIFRKQICGFFKDKKCLIVIDHFSMSKAWEEFILLARPSKEITSSSGSSKQGSRIMLITELRTLPSAATTSTHGPSEQGSPTMLATESYDHLPTEMTHCHKIRPLKDEESWKLFTIEVRPTILMLPLDFLLVGRQTISNCFGIPRDIIEVADRLSSQPNPTNSFWTWWLDKRRRGVSSHSRTEDNFAELPIYLQSCLSYLMIFPVKRISARRLVALWVAEDMIVKPAEKSDLSLEHIGMNYLQQLIDKGFVETVQSKVDGRPKECWFDRERLIMEIDVDGAISTENPRLCVDHTRDLEPSSRNQYLKSYRPLISFLCFDYRKSFEPSRQIKHFLRRGIDKNCFLSMKVLDLEGVYKPVLPKEIEKLKNLEYLGLRWTYIDDLPPFIGNLVNLRTIDVKHTFVNTFPKWICKLQYLQHLYLSENHRGKFVYRPGSLQKLESLQGIFINEDSHAEDGMYDLTNIRNLGLTYRLGSPIAIAEWVSRLNQLQSLKLKSKDQSDRPSSICLKDLKNNTQLTKMYLLGELTGSSLPEYHFPPYLRKLTLSATKLKEDPMPILGMLPNLTILRLYADSYVGRRLFCPVGAFYRLKVLKIWKLEQLEEWVIEDIQWMVLEDVDIRSCKGLKILPNEMKKINTTLKLTDMSEAFYEEMKLDIHWSSVEYFRIDKSGRLLRRSIYEVMQRHEEMKRDVTAPSTSFSSSSYVTVEASSASSSSSILSSLVLLHLLARRAEEHLHSSAKRTTPMRLPAL